MWHKEVDPFYKSPAWRKLRKVALERDHYLCQECLRTIKGGVRRRPRYAEMVHHIKPRDQCPDLALVLENLESLCNICHNKMHPEKGSGSRAETPDSPARRVRIVKI